MCREDEGAAASTLGPDALPQELARANVDTRRRLIKEAHARLASERNGRHQLAPRAAAQLVDTLVGVFDQPEFAHNARAVRLEVHILHALEASIEFQVLLERHAARK
eukprot:scaffold329902_cov67-Tisochrysis_lutea.AAC.2